MNANTLIVAPPQPKPNLGLPATACGSAMPGTAPLTAAQIILAYFIGIYMPVYRSGSAVRTASGRVVQMGEATSLPDSALIAALAGAANAPRYLNGGQQGEVKTDALPGVFRKWARVAWGDMLRDLPDEDGVMEGAGAELVRDEFRRLVRDAMLTEITVGDVIGSYGATQIERRPLIDWCFKFAKQGPWRDVRGKRCWCRIRGVEGGELVLEVAIRQELFDQIHADRRLRDMPANTFTRRAQRFGVGTSGRECRPHGQSAVKLADEFVVGLRACYGPGMG